MNAQDRLDEFKRDLTSLSSNAVVQRHITCRDPAGIELQTYIQTRERIAQNFRIHPTAVTIVGSCQLGFSLKKEKRFKQFDLSSDVDIAIVSGTLFDEFWDSIFDLVQFDRNWAANSGKRFARDLFCGWLSPSTLPNDPRLTPAREWSEFFAALTRARLCGIRRITGRLYRDWGRLEAYQRIMVDQCQVEVNST
jgi:hypothetical protein